MLPTVCILNFNCFITQSVLNVLLIILCALPTFIKAVPAAYFKYELSILSISALYEVVRSVIFTPVFFASAAAPGTDKLLSITVVGLFVIFAAHHAPTAGPTTG